jgi:hypothetical protein
MATAVMELKQENVIVAEAKFEIHPESYFPRVFVFVREEQVYYELLRTGMAVPWKETPAGRGFDFWIIDVDYTRDFGMYRSGKNRRS